MQLNFLQEDDATTKAKPKPSSASKSTIKSNSADDLFGGLPSVTAPPKAHKTTTVKTEEKSSVETLKKAEGAFKTISEAAAVLDVPQHVLRFWESRFSQIKPLKMGGGRRYYRPEDMDVLNKVKNLLYKQGYTIKGAKKAFNLKEEKEDNIETNHPTIEKPIESKKTFILTDKQKKQVSAIHSELLGLRETLRPYLAKKAVSK